MPATIEIEKTETQIIVRLVSADGDELMKETCRQPRAISPNRFDMRQLFAARRKVTQFAIKNGLELF